MRMTGSIAGDLRAFLTNTKLRLPRQLPVRQLAALISAVHAADGGASIHSRFGNLKGQPLFAVSLYPERTARINGSDVPAVIVLAYIRQNRDLLEDPRAIIGSWYNADEETSYLDVAVVLSDEAVAAQLGEQYNQIAIYDLAREQEIELGGTGEENTNTHAEAERLPPLIY